jgi:hypothetical protein
VLGTEREKRRRREGWQPEPRLFNITESPSPAIHLTTHPHSDTFTLLINNTIAFTVSFAITLTLPVPFILTITIASAVAADKAMFAAG